MKFALILIALASSSTAQIVFPDEYAELQAATARPQKSFLPVSNSNGNVNDNRNTFTPQQFPPAQQRPTPQRDVNRAPSPSNAQAGNVISKGILKFAWNMDTAIATARSRFVPGSRENIVFSPLSVSAVLALVLLGSAGKTFEEVSTILGLNNGLGISENSEAVHQMFGDLIRAVNSEQRLPGLPETSIATGIFVRNDYTIRPEFKTASQNIYGSEVTNLDFKNNGQSAARTLNNWVNNRTGGKIPRILSGPPSADTSVIIASALYFNGEWKQHFIDGATRKKSFTIAPGETVTVDMMYNGGEFPFFEDTRLGTKIVGLPYKGNEVTMYVVLPTEPGYEGLRKLENRLDPSTLERLIGSTENRSCIIGLPRMKLSSTLNLGDALQSLGLRSLFDPLSADLSLISPGSFSRIKPDEPEVPRIVPGRSSFFQYDDTVRGYHIEQWATGFSIRRLANARLRRSLESHKLRAQRSAVLQNEENRVENEAGNTVSENRVRNRRQTRQFNQNSPNGVENQSYGIDNLRHNDLLENPRLYADEVLHRVEIEVTETGTVAAAATAVILTKDGNQKRLLADRPFLFFIRHEPTGLILFWGSVVDPTSGSPSSSTQR